MGGRGDFREGGEEKARKFRKISVSPGFFLGREGEGGSRMAGIDMSGASGKEEHFAFFGGGRHLFRGGGRLHPSNPMNERQERVKRQGRETFRGAFDDGATARRRAFPAGGRRNNAVRWGRRSGWSRTRGRSASLPNAAGIWESRAGGGLEIGGLQGLATACPL